MDSTKLCECGCGQPAPIAKWSVKSLGIIKGQPRRFVRFHHLRQLQKPFWFLVQDCGYETPCYVWQCTRNSSGYGIFRRNGKHYVAHRQVLIGQMGPLPPGIHALHKCDNPPCIRPDHLFAGTQSDNMQDMYAKKRHNKPHPLSHCGEGNPASKLSVEQIRTIRRRFARGGVTLAELGREYGVKGLTIDNAVKRKTWKHVLDD